MSQTDVETLRGTYAAISRGNWDAAFGMADSDFQFKTGDRITSPGTYQGTEAVRSFFADFWAAFEQVTAEPEQFFDHGDRIVALVLLRLRPRGSSAEVEMRVGHLWTMRDGKTVRCEVFPEPEQAIAAVERSEQDVPADSY
jgi:ketosteroid isomerase-like protein